MCACVCATTPLIHTTNLTATKITLITRFNHTNLITTQLIAPTQASHEALKASKARQLVNLTSRIANNIEVRAFVHMKLVEA